MKSIVFNFFILISFCFDSRAVDGVYRLLKEKSNFEIQDFVLIASELKTNNYEVLPLISLKKGFISKGKKGGDVIDQELDKFDPWETYILFFDLDQFQSELSRSEPIRYIRAKKLFERGSYKQAISEIRSMNKSSELYARSLFMLGLMFLYNNQFEAAINAFDGCKREFVNRSEKRSNPDIKSLDLFIADKCEIGMARTYFKKKDWEESIASYKKIQINSFDWPRSLLEMAWVFYKTKQYDKSFARNLTLENKAFSKFMLIENRLLTILNLYQNCYYKEALDLSTKTIQEYDSRLKSLSSYSNLSKESEWKQFESDKIETPFIFYRKSLLKKVKEDIKKVKKLREGLIKETFLQELNSLEEKLTKDLNGFVKERITRKYKSIGRNMEDILAVKLSIINRIKLDKSNEENINRLSDTKLVKTQNALGEKEKPKSSRKLKVNNIKKDKVRWQFNNEYWPDEIEDIAITLDSRCS